MSNSIRIVIADDHPMFREGVLKTLSEVPDFEVVAVCTNADDAEAAVRDALPDIVLLDISMPGGGIAAARHIALSCPIVKILMLTVSEDNANVLAALEAGARGYILKGIGGKELIRIVRATQDGESYISPELAGRLLAGFKRANNPAGAANLFSDLTAREEEILKGVARGLSNKEIARELSLSDKTIKHYVTNILQKLQVRNRVEAALKAREHYGETQEGK